MAKLEPGLKSNFLKKVDGLGKREVLFCSPQNLNELEQFCKEEWAKIPKQTDGCDYNKKVALRSTKSGD